MPPPRWDLGLGPYTQEGEGVYSDRAMMQESFTNDEDIFLTCIPENGL